MKKLLVAVTTFATILVSAAPVHAAVSFDFSFTNQFPLGGVNGTVAGRIDGPQRLPLSSSPAAQRGFSTHFLHQTTFLLSPLSLSGPILLR